jgi:hypothetical protein
MEEEAPRVIDGSDGGQYWLIDGVESPIRDWNVSSGRASLHWTGASARFEELRKGAYDANARVSDMDLAGIELSLNFPSAVWGFAGRVFSAMNDKEVGLACLRAYNDCGSSTLSWQLERFEKTQREVLPACHLVRTRKVWDIHQFTLVIGSHFLLPVQKQKRQSICMLGHRHSFRSPA